jgi:tetratricopeptide (TPR) repeat protein
MAAATRADTADAPLSVREGEMLLAVGSVDAALAQANRAIQLDPRMPAAWALRGRVFSRLNQPDRALSDMYRALEFEPNHRDLLLQMAGIYRQLGQPSRSLTTLHRLIDCYPPGEVPQEALWLEGLALHDLGRGRQAAESLVAASRRGPPRPDVFYVLAQVQAALGDQEAAASSARQALAIDASHAPSRQLLSQLTVAGAPANEQRR